MAARTPEAPVSPQFLERWSTRAFSPEPLSDEQIASLFEAARWAPSAFNEQPWLYVYAHTPETIGRFLPILNETNQSWAHRAPLLALVFARRTFAKNGKPNRWAPFDAGASWMSLALQAHAMGLFSHGMAGFDQQRAYDILGVDPAAYDAIAAIAVGRRGDVSQLTPDQQAREVPNDRKPLADVARAL